VLFASWTKSSSSSNLSFGEYHCLKTSENVRFRAHRQMIWHSNAQRWLVLMFRVGKQISNFYALASFSQVVNNWMKKNTSQNFFRSFFLSRIT
jgi:hypothetical protein